MKQPSDHDVSSQRKTESRVNLKKTLRDRWF
jgi:hypothetical protein